MSQNSLILLQKEFNKTQSVTAKSICAMCRPYVKKELLDIRISYKESESKCSYEQLSTFFGNEW